jgi:hypothetical protein
MTQALYAHMNKKTIKIKKKTKPEKPESTNRKTLPLCLDSILSEGE